MKTWYQKNISELKTIACYLGDHMADWVEQALEWAQRIANGETWEAVCNDRDTAIWCRVIEWKNGYARSVGGSQGDDDNDPASDVYDCDYFPDDVLLYVVPLVVL